MRCRPSLLTRILRKLRGQSQPLPQATPRRARRPERKLPPSLEPLEGRIAPATIINPTTVVYKDVDGDVVTVKFSKPLFDGLSDSAKLTAANAVLKFNTGTVDTVSSTFSGSEIGQQLQLMDLTQGRTVNGVNVAVGTTITVSVAKAASGDGFTNVGYIRAFEPAAGNVPAKQVPLGAVRIAGDLGQIDAGGLTTSVGLASLTVKSLGVADPATTQPAANATTLPSGRSLVSNIIGSLGSLTVTDDVRGTIRVDNGNTVFGKIGNVTIGGSLIGGATAESGSIFSATDIGVVKIGRSATTGILGGSGADSGRIEAGGIFPGKIASLSVTGKIAAGAGAGSGSVFSKTTIGAVVVTGDIDGSGAGSASRAGTIEAEGAITSLTVTGDLIGGANPLTGFVSAGGDLGAVRVKNLVGGAGTNSGSISAGGKIASLTVLEDITGGSGFGSASVSSGGNLDLVGDIGAIKISGKLVGGSTQNSGSISSGGRIASLTIGPATAVNQVLIDGGDGLNSGSIFSRGAIGAVRVAGNVEGGAGAFSGSIVSRDFIGSTVERPGTIGAVTITGSLTGGSGADSGQIRADGRMTSVTLGTTGGTEGDLTAGTGDRSGSIRAGQGIVEAGVTGAITIRGDLVNAGSGVQAGGVISEGRITSVTITKTIAGGTIRTGDDLGALTVTGNVTNAQVSARGVAVQGATDLAIGRITINGSISNSSIRAGYDTSFTTAVNPDAQIGAVAIRGNWTATDLIAGVISGGNGFGNTLDAKIAVQAGADNPRIISQIASITVGGIVSGTPAGTNANDHFGIVAQRIVAARIGGIVVPLSAAGGESFALSVVGQGATNDIAILEVAV